MKNKALLLATVLLLVLGLMTACSASGSVDMGQKNTSRPANGTENSGNAGDRAAGSNISEADTITPEQAQKIALDHVQLTADQVTSLRTRYDMDDGIPEYDVEFYYDTFEYEFEIHAQTGKILSFEKDD